VTGTLTLLSWQPAHWTTVAWATRTGALCWAAYRTPMQDDTSGTECPWTGGDVRAGGTGIGDLDPSPGITLPPGDGLQVPAIGLVTPRAARIQVTFFGREFSAAVVRVPLGGGKSIGVYLIWLRLPAGVSTWSDTNTGPATAYDATGHVVARHGPGM
jgi:hypothetical protein